MVLSLSRATPTGRPHHCDEHHRSDPTPLPDFFEQLSGSRSSAIRQHGGVRGDTQAAADPQGRAPRCPTGRGPDGCVRRSAPTRGARRWSTSATTPACGAARPSRWTWATCGSPPASACWSLQQIARHHATRRDADPEEFLAGTWSAGHRTPTPTTAHHRSSEAYPAISARNFLSATETPASRARRLGPPRPQRRRRRTWSDPLVARIDNSKKRPVHEAGLGGEVPSDFVTRTAMSAARGQRTMVRGDHVDHIHVWGAEQFPPGTMRRAVGTHGAVPG
jgi:hypothetical protein